MALIDTLGKAGGNAVGGVFNKTLGRLFSAGLNKGAESPLNTAGQARWSSRDAVSDFRVKLTLPQASDLRSTFFTSELMNPLSDTGGIVFPLTPTIILQHQASYNPLAMTHSNHPFYAYQNSEASSFTVVGDFPVQNQSDARHWIATLHFLRAVTKMFFGQDDGTGLKGNPPPILKFNAYGDNVFNNVPVVVTNFTVELTNSVDYICTKQEQDPAFANVRGLDEEFARGDVDPNSSLPTSWAPAMSMFNIQLQPVYSRSAMKDFSMQKFVNGESTNKGFEFI